MLGDETGFFHVPKHGVGERGIGGKRPIGIKFGKLLFRLGPEAGSKFFK